MILCALAYVSVGTHVPQLVWKSEDNPYVQLLLQPSLNGRVSHLLFTVALLQGLLLFSPHCPVEVLWEHSAFVFMWVLGLHTGQEVE